MLSKIRQYLTPVVATVALALLGTTALAVTPEIIDRLGENSLDQVGDTLESKDTTDTTGITDTTDTTDTADVIDELKSEDTDTDPLDENGENDADIPTSTVTPTGGGNEKPNHGHFVSCVAHMAREDSTLQGRQKGAVVSYAARQDIVLPKDDDAACAVAYAAAKAGAAAPPVDGDDTEGDVTDSSTVTQKRETDAVSGGAKETHKPAGQGHGPKPAGQKGGGRGAN